jgi:hypothetical protein
MARLGLRCVSAPAPSSFWPVNVPPHSAEFARFALKGLAAADGGSAVTASPVASRVTVSLRCPGGIRCQPIPGWKQSMGEASVLEVRAGKPLVFPVLRATGWFSVGLLGPVCGLGSGAIASKTARLTKSCILSSIIVSDRTRSLEQTVAGVGIKPRHGLRRQKTQAQILSRDPVLRR